MSDSVVVGSVASLLQQETYAANDDVLSCTQSGDQAKVLAMAAVAISIVIFASAIIVAVVIAAIKVKRRPHYGTAEEDSDDYYVEDVILEEDELQHLPPPRSESFSDLYVTMPPQVDLARPLGRPYGGGRRMPSLPALAEEDEMAGDRERIPSFAARNSGVTANAMAMASGGRMLRVPEHVSLYRTASQEMVDKMSRLLLNNEDLFKEDDFRRRSSSGSNSGATTGKWRLSRPDVLMDNLIFKRLSASEASGPSPSSSRRGSSSPNQTHQAQQSVNYLTSPQQTLSLRNSPSVSPRLFKSTKSMFDKPENEEPIRKQSKPQFRPPNVKGKQIQKMVAAFGGNLVKGIVEEADGNDSKSAAGPSVIISSAAVDSVTKDGVKVPPIRSTKERLRMSADMSSSQQPKAFSPAVAAAINSPKLKSRSVSTTSDVFLYRRQRRSGVNFTSMDSKDSMV